MSVNSSKSLDRSSRSRVLVARRMLGGIACMFLLGACQGGAENADNTARLAALETQLQQTQQRLLVLEDIEAINKLNRAYGYYIDKGLWDHVVDLFAADSSVEIGPRGVYQGKAGVETLFLKMFGGGKIGLDEGRLFNHLILQGIVHVSEDGTRAKGRWRTFAQVAAHQRNAIWTEGVYENTYVKEDGIWKYESLKYWPTYYTDFDQGWKEQGISDVGRGAMTPSTQYPADAPPSGPFKAFPDYFVPPFHYTNPVSGRAVEVAPEHSG